MDFINWREKLSFKRGLTPKQEAEEERIGRKLLGERYPGTQCWSQTVADRKPK